jgi:hypothetical protein
VATTPSLLVDPSMFDCEDGSSYFALVKPCQTTLFLAETTILIGVKVPSFT